MKVLCIRITTIFYWKYSICGFLNSIDKCIWLILYEVQSIASIIKYEAWYINNKIGITMTS